MTSQEHPVEVAAPGRPARRGILARFARNRSGSTAIEFTALAIPFSLLVFAILESCISFAGQEVLANTTDDVARLLRTGQVKAADVTKESVRTLICDRLSVIVADNCPGLEFDLREVTSFQEAAALGIPFNSAKDDIITSGFIVKPGKSMSKNALRVFYRWPIMTDIMRKSMSSLKDNKTLHFSMAVWQNEPFDD
jgi:Flp pilus assembly protein TadG